ncbi:PIG-L deacetylase family protein [Plastoroseomonas arctica]|uniref:GlcNAc-PI de-N-acetylase n=1 Tax=Plastoroseomonas arctica TaxID=1509237 RepID=A0AAF1JZJ0_9PROT|nr:PIG-L family deacetylase [Plastoroseomonas arctica]MBR0656830.1 hypothetical protein [Plastoroseomonas arctica]
MGRVKLRRAGALMRGAVVVVAPHPDDETIGCGALLAESLARRRRLLVVLTTDGGASHPGSQAWSRARRAMLRAREMRSAVARLGGGRRHLQGLGLPDGAMPSHGPVFENAVASLCRAVRRMRARLIVAPSRVDEHHDHRASFRLAEVAARRCGAALAEYAVWGLLPSGPTCTLRTLRHARRRVAALDRHHSQFGRGPKGFGDGFVVPPALRARARDAAEHYRISWR